MTGTVFVCTDICGDTCCCCGGSATLGGTQEAIVGSAATLRYCSIECHDEWEDHLASERERMACCPSCGFDCQEHADDCPEPSRSSATP